MFDASLDSKATLESLFEFSSLPCSGSDHEAYAKDLAALEASVRNKSTLFHSDCYAGHMNYDVSKPHMDALRIAQKYNQNAVALESAPSTFRTEHDLIMSIAKEIGYDGNAWGYVSTGGTVSNLEGLWIARNKAKAQKRNPTYVLASTDCHYSIRKSCDILGLECKPLIVDVNVAPAQIAAVVCVCGSTETGSVDDIPFWHDYCTRYNIHLHIDAAYGGYYIYAKDSPLLKESARTALSMLHCADSITIDPHKTGYAPYPTGMFLLKSRDDTRYVNSLGGVAYIKSTSTTPFTVEGSRSGAIVAAASFGHTHMHPHYKAIFEANLAGAQMLKDYLARSEVFELYPDSDMGMVLFTTKNIEQPDQAAEETASPSSASSAPSETARPILPMSYLAEKFCRFDNAQHGHLQFVTTKIEGRRYFRICVMNPFLKDRFDDFTKRLEADYAEYAAQFDSFVEQRVQNILTIAEECDTVEELRQTIRSGKEIVAYNGFEPSGRIHIAQAIITVLNANLLVENGCRVKLYIADWFAQLNHKMGGDLAKIKTVGRYFIEVFKACGISADNVEFVWASDLITQSTTYWPRVLHITTQTTYKRAIRCSQIMGRKDDDALSVSQLLYPCMQAADIFELDVDMPQLGVDQRKCNMLAREYAEKAHLKKPISVAHHMLMGLKGSKAGKMSKSIPDSAIFMEDSENEVNRKITAAFCDDNIEGNPICEYIKYIILRWFGKILVCGKTYQTMDELERDFATIDKKELKTAVAACINQILNPVRIHFSQGAMKELAETVASFTVTR